MLLSHSRQRAFSPPLSNDSHCRRMSLNVSVIRLVSAFALLLIALSTPLLAGGLPVAVDGEPLPSLAPMLERTTPAVVNISTTGSVAVNNNSLFEDPFFRQFFDLPQQRSRRQTQSLGSGVIVDAANGYIVTNFHVIDNASEILVTLNDGREFSAELLGKDPDADIALIKIEPVSLTELSWSDSDALRVGDFVVAIGNPFGLGQTVTSGIVSALGRSGLGIEEIEDFIQTDASINPGNSGGALVNLRGELIGINTAIVGPGGGNVGIGFAIPSNMARDLLQQLLQSGEVRRGRLGISLQELTDDLQEAFGVERGVVISGVGRDTPAEFSGLQRGDVLVRIGDRKVRSIGEVKNAIGLLQIGDSIDVTFYRDRERYETSIEVGEPEDTSIHGHEIASHLAGAEFENAATRSRQRYVRIASIEAASHMARYRFREGDIILSANRINIDTVQDLVEAVAAERGSTLLEVQRGSSVQSVRVE